MTFSSKTIKKRVMLRISNNLSNFLPKLSHRRGTHKHVDLCESHTYVSVLVENLVNYLGSIAFFFKKKRY